VDRGEVRRGRVRRPGCVALPALEQQAVREPRQVDLPVVPRLLAARPQALQLLPVARPPVALAMQRSIQSTRRKSGMTQRSMPIDFSFSYNSRGFSIHYKFGQILTPRFSSNNRMLDIRQWAETG